MNGTQNNRLVLRISIIALFTIIVLSLAFLTKINARKVIWIYPFVICLPIPMIALRTFYRDRKEYEKLWPVVLLLLTPFFAGLVYTLLLTEIKGSMVSITMRAMSVTGQRLFIIVLAVSVIALFRNDAIDVLSDAMIISYMYTVIMAICGIGLQEVVHYISVVAIVDNSENHRWLEMHDNGLTVGMLLFYEVLLRREKRMSRIVLLALTMFFCFKRTALLALLIILVLWIIMSRKGDSVKELLSTIVLLSVLLGSLAYIALLSNGEFYALMEGIGFDFSNRKYLYVFMRKFYEWTPRFIGHGLGFTSRYMGVISGTLEGARLWNMTALHNDILNTYIDLGFVGSLLWFGWATVIVSSAIKRRYGINAKVVYCMMTVYAYTVYTTDNAAFFFGFQFVYYTMVFYGCMSADTMEHAKKSVNKDYYKTIIST